MNTYLTCRNPNSVFLQIRNHTQVEYLLPRHSISHSQDSCDYLNDVASKGSSKSLLFGVVKLIIGEVPGILHLWLRHVLIQY